MFLNVHRCFTASLPSINCDAAFRRRVMVSASWKGKGVKALRHSCATSDKTHGSTKEAHKSQSSFNCFSLSLCTCLSAVTISKFSASSFGSCDFMSENLQRKRESAADVGASRRFQSFSSLLICFKFLRIWKAGCGAKHGMTCSCRPAGSPCMNEHVELRFVHTKHTTVYTYTNAETPKQVCTHTIKGIYILFVSTYLACSHDFTWHDRTQY